MVYVMLFTVEWDGGIEESKVIKVYADKDKAVIDMQNVFIDLMKVELKNYYESLSNEKIEELVLEQNGVDDLYGKLQVKYYEYWFTLSLEFVDFVK